MPYLRIQNAIVLSALLFTSVVAFDASRAKTSAAHVKADPVMAITRMPADDDAALKKLVAETGKLAKTSGGVESVAAFKNARKNTESVLLNVFPSVKAAESFALAMDGHATQKALEAVAPRTKRSVKYYRRARNQKYSDGKVGHIEVVVYRTKPGVTRKQNLKMLDAAEEGFAKGGDGLIGHSTWISADGVWVHMVLWRSAADYQKTSKTLMRQKGVFSWIRSLDFKRFVVTQGDVMASFSD